MKEVKGEGGGGGEEEVQCIGVICENLLFWIFFGAQLCIQGHLIGMPPVYSLF